MANVNEILVGNDVKVKDELFDTLKFINALATGNNSDCFGKVVAVEPTTEQIKQYKEINPSTDGTGKVIYFDVTADRHFVISTEMIDVVVEGGVQ